MAIVVCDATEGVTSEDLRIAEMAMKAGCATLLALNKWDVTRTDIDDARARVEQKLRLRPAGDHLLGADAAATAEAAVRGAGAGRPRGERIPTPELNRFVADRARTCRQPPAARGRRLRLYYMAQFESARRASRSRSTTAGLITRD